MEKNILNAFKNVTFTGGRLKMFAKVWAKYTSDNYILNAIKGYKLEFQYGLPPHQSEIPFPYKLSKDEKDAVDGEINRLASLDVIELSDANNGFVSNIFTRPKKDGGYRMILDLSDLNKCIDYQHFKMETLETAISLVPENSFMTSIDLKDAYYSVPIAEEHRQFLKFIWNGECWQFKALPNGLTSGPRLFTKLLKPPLAFLRKLGISIVAYIDDTLIISPNETEAIKAVTTTTETLAHMGFVVHPTKSMVRPSQNIVFLGFEINSITMTVKLTQSKKDEINQLCRILLTEQCYTIRVVASVIGKLVAAFPAVQYGKLHYRELEREKSYALKQHHGHFDRVMSLSNLAKADILWWLSNVNKAYRIIGIHDHTLTITSDASGLGWGATNGKTHIGGRWNRVEKLRAECNEINYLEMLAAFHGLRAFCAKVQGVHILLRMDNTTAVAYVNNMGGIKSISCNEMAKMMWHWCIQRNIFLTASYLPGSQNEVADKKSRKFADQLEWMLNPAIFSQICQQNRK